MRINRKAFVVAAIIIAIVSVIIVYRRMHESFYTSYSLSASDADDTKVCDQCISTHKNDKKNLCSCLKNNQCSDDISKYCKGSAGNLSGCDECTFTYGKCMSDNFDYKKCRSELCDCLKKENCEKDLINQTCAALPDSGTSSASSCAPEGGVWSKDGKLAGPCCVPPDYRIHDSSYKGCQNFSEETDGNKKSCLENCCKFVSNQARNYDPSWAPMAQCACSLCCNNMKEPHFKKWGSCVHYISGDPAEANTPDGPEAGDQSWRGWIGWDN
jgi:hypothetical protein